MSIYNPLQYNNQSFSSRVLDTFKEQEAKKQASLDKMNETLRTEAAQGQLGDLANGILNDALAQASEQGLIGVNQYEIMNKAMPQFYAAKSAVTELNNAYNAELKAAQADDAINVDANFLAYLNDKYYSDDVSLENIDSHTANAISKGFNIAENSQFLNEEYVLDKVIPTMVKEFSNSEYGIVGSQNGTNVYGTTTTKGVVRATAETIGAFTQNPQLEALLIKQANKENPNANITSLDLQVPKEEQARLLNNILDAKFPSSSTIQGATISEADRNRMAMERARALAYTQDYIDRAREDEKGAANYAIDRHQRDMLAAGVEVSRQEAVDFLLTVKDEKTNQPLYNRNALMNALNTKSDKLTADEREDMDNQEFADSIYARDYSSIQSVLDLSARTVGKLTVGKVYKSGDNLVLEVSRGEKDRPLPILLPMTSDKTQLTADAQKKLKDLMVNRGIGDKYIKDATPSTSTTPTEDKEKEKDPPKKVTKSEESKVIDWEKAAETAAGN